MNDYYEWLIKGSPNHVARLMSSPGEVQISATDSDSEESVERFRPICEEAMAKCDEVLSGPRVSSRHSGGYVTGATLQR
jgi:hypothetical protein